MAYFTKHRTEVETYSVQYKRRLADSEVLSTPVIVKVYKWVVSSQTWEDVSSEFGNPVGTISGTLVNFSLAAASGPTEQLSDDYSIYVKVQTSASRSLVETPDIYISDDLEE